MACEMHVNAFQRIVQPNITLLDCSIYLYDTGILPVSAYQCTLENVYLRSDLPSNSPFTLNKAKIFERTVVFAAAPDNTAPCCQDHGSPMTQHNAILLI